MGATVLFVCNSTKLLPEGNLYFTTYFQPETFRKQGCVCADTRTPRPGGQTQTGLPQLCLPWSFPVGRRKE